MVRNSTRKMVLLALLVAGAAVLHVVESWIPVPLPVPGAKLGLANIVTLAVIMEYGTREGLVIAFLRTVLGSLLGGTFLSLGFFLALSGGLMSAVVMGVLSRRLSGQGISTTGLSLAGAVTHNVTQLSVAMVLVSHAGLFMYLPFLLFVAIPTGYFVGLVANMLHNQMPSWK